MVAANRCKPVQKTRVLQLSILQIPLPAWFCSGLVHTRTRACLCDQDLGGLGVHHQWTSDFHSISGRICMWLLVRWILPSSLSLSTFIPSPSSNFCDQMRATMSFGDIFEVCVYMEKIILFFFFSVDKCYIGFFFCTY